MFTLEQFKTLPIENIVNAVYKQSGGEISDDDSINISDLIYCFLDKIEDAVTGVVEDHAVEVVLENEEGDSEGGGEYSEKVFSLKADDIVRYFRVTGYYASYDGTTWDDEIIEVIPKQVTVTQYFNK